MPVEGKKDPWWATPLTIALIVVVGAPVISGIVWVVVKIWIDILHMTGC